jgi:hypothetical protein
LISSVTAKTNATRNAVPTTWSTNGPTQLPRYLAGKVAKSRTSDRGLGANRGAGRLRDILRARGETAPEGMDERARTVEER